MTTAEIVTQLAEKLNMSKREAETAYKTVLDCLFDAVVDDGSFRTGFGTFNVVTRAARPARTGRNPRTGESLEIPAKPESKTIKFTPNKSFKATINAE